MCVFSSGCPKIPETPVFCNPLALHSHILLYVRVYVCLNVRVFLSTHTIYSNFLSPLCLSVCCSAVKKKTCFAGRCVVIKDKKRETLLLSAFLCFTASLHCCDALCSCVLPRLPSALCVLLIRPSVHRKAAVRQCCCTIEVTVPVYYCVCFVALCRFVCALQ